ncbi:methyltransferase [Cutibacterium acnes JCM 18920]|nr:methyltransferase [Cutibacterium acnes JCM 18920]
MLCPTVAHCRAVASYGADVLAVHRDPDTAAKLNRIPGVMAVCGSPESLPLNSSSFDAVLVHQAFTNWPPASPYLKSPASCAQAVSSASPGWYAMTLFRGSSGLQRYCAPSMKML